MKNGILLFLLTTLLQSCISAYKIYPVTDRKLKDIPEKDVVFISNKDSFPKAYKVLKHANIYTFTNDSLNTNQIKLHKLEKTTWFCGQPMLGSMITFGQLPVQFPDKYRYTFDIMKRGRTETHSYDIEVHQSLWFWNIFSNKKNFKKQIGIAVAAKYAE